VEYCHKCMIVHRDLKPENLLLSADRKHLVISDFGLSTGMQGSRNLLKTRCGTVHYISPEVAKGDPYVGMASDIWSVGIILYAMVTATLPFDGPNSVAVLKRIVRGEFNIPSYVPRELQDLIRLMLTLDPKERIIIPQIKQHPWYLGVEETPRHIDQLEKPYVLQIPEIESNSDVISNLRLLGWEQSELMDELLDQEKMNMAKAFFKLLVEQKNLPADPTDTPQNIDKTVLRRRSIGAGTSAARIGVTTDTTKAPVLMKNRLKRSSQRGSQRIAQPVTRTNSRPYNSSAESAQTRSTTSNQPQTNEKTKEKTSPIHSPKSEKSSEKSKAVIWTAGIEPELKHSLESTKSVTQILEALKHCFADLGQYDLSAKHTKNGLKVKARKSGKRHGPPVVTVNIGQPREGEEGGQKVIIKGKKSREELKEFTKKVEETLVV